MTAGSQAELDGLLEELVRRAEERKSTISVVELRGLHDRGDIEALRFHHKHWDGSASSDAGISLSVSAVTYKAAKLIGEDPNSFITDDHIAKVRELWPLFRLKQSRYGRTIELAPYMALALGNPELEDHLVSLVDQRGMTDVDELREMLEGVADLPTPMHGGAL